MVVNKKSGGIDDAWLHMVLGCIGETLDPSGDMICGVCVSIRKREDRVAIWTRSVDDAKALELGRRMRAICKVEDKIPIKFSTAGREGSTAQVGGDELFKLTG